MFTKTIKDDVSSFVCRLDKLVLKYVNEFIRVLNAVFFRFKDRFFVQKTWVLLLGLHWLAVWHNRGIVVRFYVIYFIVLYLLCFKTTKVQFGVF